MSAELTLIIAIIGLVVSILSIVSFIMGRRDKGKQDGEAQGKIANSLKYIEQAQTNILIGQKEVTAKLDKINEEVIVLKVRENNLEERVERLESKRGV